MSDKVKCPMCGANLDLVPHPSEANRQVAYCTCRGAKVPVISVLKSHITRTPPEKKEGEK